MDQAMLAKMVRAGKITPEELLAHTPLDRLDDTLTLLKRHEFGELKDIYFKHCGSAERSTRRSKMSLVSPSGLAPLL